MSLINRPFLLCSGSLKIEQKIPPPLLLLDRNKSAAAQVGTFAVAAESALQNRRMRIAGERTLSNIKGV